MRQPVPGGWHDLQQYRNSTSVLSEGLIPLYQRPTIQLLRKDFAIATPISPFKRWIWHPVFTPSWLCTQLPLLPFCHPLRRLELECLHLQFPAPLLQLPHSSSVGCAGCLISSLGATKKTALAAALFVCVVRCAAERENPLLESEPSSKPWI